MKILNKVKVLATFTTLVLAFSNQSAFSAEISGNYADNSKNQEKNNTTTELIQASAFLSSSTKAVKVNDSLIYLPVPQPLIILCVLGLAGLSSFLKLKIAQAKYEQIQEETPEFSKLVNH